MIRLRLFCSQVIKIGTSSLINEKYGTLNLSSLSRICEVVRELHAKGETQALLSTSDQHAKATVCYLLAASWDTLQANAVLVPRLPAGFW
jgi:glutamate 5-kinase